MRPCACGHPRRLFHPWGGGCLGNDCRCREFRIVTGGRVPEGRVPPAPVTVDQPPPPPRNHR